MLGCASDEAAYHATLPGTSSGASIEWLGEVGGYLDVRVGTAGRSLRFFLPAANPDCLALREASGEIRYANRGVLGRLEAGALRCEPVGILSLVEWRNRRGRVSREPVPRARATWSPLASSDTLVLVRGRFVLANQLGWAGGVDTVAVFEPGAPCDEVLARGVGSLEFRHSGPDVLALVGPDRRCPLLGIARPLP